MKRLALNLLIALYVTGCGAADDDKAAPAPAVPAAQVPASPAAPAVAEKAPTAVLHTSFAVANVSALPTCDGASEGFLAYVKADKTVQACVDGAWSKIDLRGEKGDPGAPGSTAVAAEPVQADPVPSMNQWLDPIAKVLWTTSLNGVKFTYAKTVCTGNWRLPTEAELTLAIARGLGDEFENDPIWADSGRAAKASSGAEFLNFTTQEALTFCMSTRG